MVAGALVSGHDPKLTHQTGDRERHVVIVAYPDARILDVVGPLEALTGAKYFLPDRPEPYVMTVVASCPGPVRTTSGRSLAVSGLLDGRRARGQWWWCPIPAHRLPSRRLHRARACRSASSHSASRTKRPPPPAIHVETARVQAARVSLETRPARRSASGRSPGSHSRRSSSSHVRRRAPLRRKQGRAHFTDTGGLDEVSPRNVPRYKDAGPLAIAAGLATGFLPGGDLVATPERHGEIHLASGGAAVYPRIDPNRLSTGADGRTIVEGIRTAGHTTLIETLVNEELGALFRRDAMTRPAHIAAKNSRDMVARRV